MSKLLAENMFSLGIIKLASATADLSIAEASSDYESAAIPLGFLDSIYSSELIVRTSIVKAELSANFSSYGRSVVPEMVVLGM